jgi:hypothetical protein
LIPSAFLAPQGCPLPQVTMCWSGQERRWLRQLGLVRPRGPSAKTWNTPRRSERCYSGPFSGSVVQSNLPMETIPVSERRTHSQRPRRVGPCSRRQRPRKCQLADLDGPGRARFLPINAASPHTAGHRQFSRSTDQYFEQPLPAQPCRWRYRRTATVHRGATLA